MRARAYVHVLRGDVPIVPPCHSTTVVSGTRERLQCRERAYSGAEHRTGTFPAVMGSLKKVRDDEAHVRFNLQRYRMCMRARTWRTYATEPIRGRCGTSWRTWL